MYRSNMSFELHFLSCCISLLSNSCRERGDSVDLLLDVAMLMLERVLHVNEELGRGVVVSEVSDVSGSP